MALLWLIIIAYLVGAFPTAVLTGKLVRGIDVRQHGSGNAGATNTWRVLGWKAGVGVLAIDLAKGAIAAVLIPHLTLGPIPLAAGVVAILCGLSAVIGHVFPVYIGFRGGKGVATAAGMLIAIAPVPMGIAVAVFVTALLLSGHVSLGSILGAITVPVTLILFNCYPAWHYHPLLIALTSVLALFILFTHRGNIVRLVHGNERIVPHLPIWRWFSQR